MMKTLSFIFAVLTTFPVSALAFEAFEKVTEAQIECERAPDLECMDRRQGVSERGCIGLKSDQKLSLGVNGEIAAYSENLGVYSDKPVEIKKIDEAFMSREGTSIIFKAETNAPLPKTHRFDVYKLQKDSILFTMDTPNGRSSVKKTREHCEVIPAKYSVHVTTCKTISEQTYRLRCSGNYKYSRN